MEGCAHNISTRLHFVRRAHFLYCLFGHNSQCTLKVENAECILKLNCPGVQIDGRQLVSIVLAYLCLRTSLLRKQVASANQPSPGQHWTVLASYPRAPATPSKVPNWLALSRLSQHWFQAVPAVPVVLSAASILLYCLYLKPFKHLFHAMLMLRNLY